MDGDNTNMEMIKKVTTSVINPLVHICNQSLSTGVFPDKLKLAKNIPLHKGNEKDIFNNYRPVSLLPHFSKIIEKLFANRLDEFISKNKIINDSQYGFRPNMSTAMALSDIAENITSALDNKKFTIVVFIDLKKAFDTTDYKLLLSKLEHYGIRGVASNWVVRIQYVNFENHSSEELNIVCGVPHGSSLGPLVFTIYINYICNVSPLLKYVLFVDDTNIFCSGDNFTSLNIKKIMNLNF